MHIKSFFILQLMILVCILEGCVSVRSTEITAKPGIYEPAINVSPSTIALEIPTVTPRPLASHASKPTITSTTSPPPLPVNISKDQVDKAVWDLIKGNGGCLFPCYGGIIPGQTSLTEANNIIARFGLSLTKTFADGQKDYYTFAHPLLENINFGSYLIVQNQVVQNIFGSVSFLSPEGESPVELELHTSPDALIRNYGVPSKIFLYISFPSEPGFPEGTAWYRSSMYFPAHSLIVEYGRSQTKDGELIQACPLVDRVSSIRFWIGTNPENPPIPGLRFEDATLMSLDEFSTLLHQSPESACFSIIRDAFLKVPY